MYDITTTSFEMRKNISEFPIISKITHPNGLMTYSIIQNKKLIDLDLKQAFTIFE